MEKITFNGVDYPARKLHADREEIVISTLACCDALHPGLWGYENEGFASKEAEELYDSIFFFVSEDEINLPFGELKNVLRESNPEFDFQP